MSHPESQRPWFGNPLREPDAAGPADAERLHRQLCGEILAQMAAGCVAPYPFGDALYLIGAMDPRPPQAAPARAARDPWLMRFGSWCLTWAGRARRMGQPNGGGCDSGRSSALRLSVRGLRP